MRASEGANAAWYGLEALGPGALWIGIVRTRWLEADEGVRRSKRRKCESEDTDERREGECGENAVL